MNSRHKAALAEERQSVLVERQPRAFESLHQILTILNTNRTPDAIPDFVIAQAGQLLGADGGAIYRLHKDEAIFKIQAAYELDATSATPCLPVGWGGTGQALLHRRPVTIPDTFRASLTWDDAALPLQPALLRLYQRYRAQLVAPLIIKAEIYGLLILFYDEPHEFSDEEVGLVAAVSEQAALAIENAELISATQGQAILEERQRLARDLHDSVTQALYGVTLHAEAATRLLASGDVATAAHYLRKLQDTAQEALEEMRLLIFELRPPVLDQEGLVAALQARLGAVEGRANLQTSFTAEGVSRLPPHVEQALYRIAQEALNNALKHARAGHISVSLRQQNPSVILTISDDGLGFDPALARERGGFGLCGIEERVAQLGGHFILQSMPGAGTQVRVEIAV